MQASASDRTQDTSTTLPAAYLFSAASNYRTVSTGKERDAESGNDYFGARYYASTMGRFLSPDWSAKEEPVPYAKLDDPQTLNLYSYVQNNPLSRVDKDGHIAGVDDAVEAGIVITIGVIATVQAINTMQHMPSGSFSDFTSSVASSFKSDVHSITSIFSAKRPGTRGKPDHQQTVKEEAEKIGGKPEVPIPTPGGAKETRVGDAVAKDANGNVTAVTQVIRPTPAGNVPLREQKAAQDIKTATGVTPKLVPVRPLPQQ
jgi:RHS repeat-associated protein